MTFATLFWGSPEDPWLKLVGMVGNPVKMKVLIQHLVHALHLAGCYQGCPRLVGIVGLCCPASSSSSTCPVLGKTAHPTRCSPGAPLASVSLCELGVQMRHACSSLVPLHTFKGASLWPPGSPKLPGPILDLSVPAILGAALFSDR